MKVYRCAVVSVVKHGYVPRGVASHPNFELVVVADDPEAPDWAHERNQEFADEYNIPYVKDVEAALRDYECEVGVVSSEAERHCDLGVRVAQANCHLVVDKPLSTQLSECDRLVSVLKQHDRKSLVWNRNFLPALVHARQMVADGTIGQPHAIHVDFYFSKDAGPPKGARKAEDPPLSWIEHQIRAHADGSDGGVGVVAMGELQIEGIYPLAYIRTLMGVDVQRVFTRTASHFHQVNFDNNVDDLATVTLQMADGRLGSLCIGRIGAAAHPDIGEIKLHIVGSEGALVISEARPEVGIYYRDQPEKEFKNLRIENDNDYLIMDDFLHSIENDAPAVLDAEGGRAIAATVQAAIESGKTGKVVDVPL